MPANMMTFGNNPLFQRLRTSMMAKSRAGTVGGAGANGGYVAPEGRSYQNQLQDRQKLALGQEDAFGYNTEREGWNRAAGFDPSKALAGYTDAVLSRSNRSLATSLDSLAQSSAGAGRLNTGLFDRDRGLVAQNVYQSANEDLGMKALDTARMEQGQGQFLATQGGENRNRYLDILYSNADQERANRAEGKSKKKGGLFSALGGIAGGILGAAAGPIGASIGSKLGAGIAGRISGK